MNEPTALQQLRDIHLPADVSALPPAWGWWLLGVIVLAVLIGVPYYFWRRYRRNAFKREALAELAHLQTRYKSSPQEIALVDDIAALIKRVAITCYGREEVAGRTGDRWLQFLDQSGNTRGFTQGPGRALGANRFRPEQTLDADALIDLSRDWIQKQRC